MTRVKPAPAAPRGDTKAPSVERVDPRPLLKVGIVSPYGYPHPGGVNEHVRYTYEALRAMGHDPWIITSKYGKQTENEGHIIRLGTGWAFPCSSNPPARARARGSPGSTAGPTSLPRLRPLGSSTRRSGAI